MHQLKSIYNSPFKDLQSQPIHICFAMIASNAKITFKNQLSHQPMKFLEGNVFSRVYLSFCLSMWPGGLPVQGPVQTYCKDPVPPTPTDMFKLVKFEACTVGWHSTGMPFC